MVTSPYPAEFQCILGVHLQSAFLSMCSYPFALVSIGVSYSSRLHITFGRYLNEVQPSGEDLGEGISRSQMLCYTLCCTFLSYIYEYYFYRNAGKISLKSLNIVNKLFTIRDPCGHFFVKIITWNYLNTNICLIFIIKYWNLELSKIIEHKSILTELHFNQDLFL